MKISREYIKNMEKLYRVNLINSLGGFKSVNLIGTKGSNGVENLAIFSSVVHIGADPPLIGFINRPDSVERNTISNIRDTGEFTINHVNTDIFRQAHQTSARYDKDISEFKETGLTAIYSDVVSAPYVKESNIRIGLEFKEEIKIESNDTYLIIGEIVEIDLDEEFLFEDGAIDLNKSDSLTIAGLDSYHSTKKIARLSYAKPGNDIREI